MAARQATTVYYCLGEGVESERLCSAEWSLIRNYLGEQCSQIVDAVVSARRQADGRR